MKSETAKTKSVSKRRGAKQAMASEFPFSAIVGQEEMKLALILNLIEPRIGGVLIMGHRGTAKSTVVRSLAALLPAQERVVDCVAGCDPNDEVGFCEDCRAKREAGNKLKFTEEVARVVTLPLGATEDRLCGSINIEEAMKSGRKAFEAGLLARVNRGFLYIDEVNLLEDHLVNLLLDVAASGVNVVEREGVSFRHPSRFVLVGSGNPEEGDLRPQLLDRFGLQVEVTTISDVEERMEIVMRRAAFEQNPTAFGEGFDEAEHQLRERILKAIGLYRSVVLPSELLRQIVMLCQELGIDGHRGELTISKAACAYAAYQGKNIVTDEDIRMVAPMCLRHRMRRDPLQTGNGAGKIDRQIDGKFPRPPASDNGFDQDATKSELQQSLKQLWPNTENLENRHDSGNKIGDPGEVDLPAMPARLENVWEKEFVRDVRKDQKSNGGGRQANPKSSHTALRGRQTGETAIRTASGRVSLDATLRASVIASCREGDRPIGLPLRFSNGDLRYKRFSRPRGSLFILLIDTSGSMAINRIGQVKGALPAILRQSYVRRDRVAIITFRGDEASLVLPPTRSISRAMTTLSSLPVGGATPLSLGLAKTLEIVKSKRQAEGEEKTVLVFTDGRGNVPLAGSGQMGRKKREEIIGLELESIGNELRIVGARVIVVDTQPQHLSTGSAEFVADRLKADLARLNEGSVTEAIKIVKV